MRHPGAEDGSIGIEVLTVGGWLTPGDSALDAEVDFMAVAEQQLIPARVRDEWSWLRGRGTASVCLPASQDSSHVGNAGVGGCESEGCASFNAYLCHSWFPQLI